MHADRIPLVKFIQHTIPLENKTAAAIAKNFHSKEFKRGEHFLKECKVNNDYLFLQSGFMRSYLCNTEGKEVTISFYSPNQVVFEYASFFQRIPSQENIEVLADSQGWMLTFEQLNTLFHTIPEFREFGRAILVKGLIALKTRTLSMINKTAEQRYETLLTSNPEIFQYAPLKYIASYLGITDTSLSRIRKEFFKK